MLTTKETKNELKTIDHKEPSAAGPQPKFEYLAQRRQGRKGRAIMVKLF